MSRKFEFMHWKILIPWLGFTFNDCICTFLALLKWNYDEKTYVIMLKFAPCQVVNCITKLGAFSRIGLIENPSSATVKHSYWSDGSVTSLCCSKKKVLSFIVSGSDIKMNSSQIWRSEIHCQLYNLFRKFTNFCASCFMQQIHYFILMSHSSFMA